MPDDRDKDLEKLETETDDKLGQIDYRARPSNDRRMPKPILQCRPILSRSPPNSLKDDCLTPQTSHDYLTTVAPLQQSRQQRNEVRGILPERRKMPHG